MTETTDTITIDAETAQMIGTVAGGVLTVCGLPEVAPLAAPAAKLIQRLTDSGVEVPGLAEFKDKVDAFAANVPVPEA